MADVSALQQSISTNIFANNNRQITANSLLSVFGVLVTLLQSTITSDSLTINGLSTFNSGIVVRGTIVNELGNGSYFNTSNVLGAGSVSLHNNTTPSALNAFLSDSAGVTRLNGSSSTVLSVGNDTRLATSISGTQINGKLTVAGELFVDDYDLLVDKNILTNNTTASIGNIANNFQDVYTTTIRQTNGSALSLFTSGTGSIRFATADLNSEYARFFGTTGNVVFKSKGAAAVDDGFKVDIFGNVRVSGNISIGGTINLTSLSTATDNTGTIGSATLNYSKANIRNIESNNKLMIMSRRANGTHFGYNVEDNATFLNSYAGFRLTTGNMYLQANGAIPVDDVTYRLQVLGAAKFASGLTVAQGLSVTGGLYLYDTTYIYGTMIMQGSIIPNSHAIFNLGDETNGYLRVSTQALLSPYDLTIRAGQHIRFRFNASDNEFARFAPTSGNFILQTLGSAPTDTGDRLQVHGTTFFDGTVKLGGSMIPTGGNFVIIGNTTNYLQSIYTSTSYNQYIRPLDTAGIRFRTTSAEIIANMFDSGNWQLGNISDSGEKLQVVGTSKFTGTASFVGNWNGTTGQVRFGSLNQAGIVSFMSGNGSAQAFIGYLTATGTDFVINPTTSLGTIALGVGSNTALKIFNNTNVVLGTGTNAAYIDSGEKLQVLGSSRFTGAMSLESAWNSSTGQLKLGNSTNAGLITLAGAGGVSQGYVGYLGATNANFVIGNYTSGGSVGFDTSVNTVMKLFNDGAVVLQTGLNASITSSGEKLQVVGSAKITGGIAVQTLPVYADNAAASSLSAGTFYRTATGVVMVKY